jgi:hypothetical protein
LRAGLAPLGIAIGPPLGFNDGYGIAVTRAADRASRCARWATWRSIPTCASA